jgi:hypothetical protein
MYHILDYAIRLFAGDRNEGSHGNFPYPGEWEAAAGGGAPESVKAAGKDSTRIIPHHRFRVVLTPEPSRIDYRRNPEVLRDWAWLILPVRWGYPAAPSLGSEIKMIDLGNRAPFGAAYNTSWNRAAHGLLYPSYQVKKLGAARSMIEDLLQPWYYLYIFRTPRFVHDVPSALDRKDMVRLGLAPPGGWAEMGIGGPLLGVHVGFPAGGFSDLYETSTGYQKFSRNDSQGGSLFVYPFTTNAVVRAPDALIRPYATVGGGVYGWESRVFVAPEVQTLKSGWNMGWTAGAGLEYYLRPKVALDLGVRYHATGVPASAIGSRDGDLRFLALWVGHYIRF